MRLDLVDVVADRIENGLDGLRAQLRVIALRKQQLGAMEVEPRRAAFVHLDMRLAVAHHAAVRRNHRR